MSETRTRNIERVKAVMECLSTGRYAEIGDHVSEDILFELPYGPGAKPVVIQGRDAFVSLNAQTWPGFRFFRQTITQIHELLDEDKLIVEYESDGAIEATGKPYQNRYVGIFGFRDGLIREWHEFHNPDVPAEAFRPD